MAAFGRFNKKIGCELLCKHFRKIADNSTDKEFFKVYSVIDEVLNYKGLLDAVFNSNIGNLNKFIDSVKKQ